MSPSLIAYRVAVDARLRESAGEYLDPKRTAAIIVHRAEFMATSKHDGLRDTSRNGPRRFRGPALGKLLRCW